MARILVVGLCVCSLAALSAIARQSEGANSPSAEPLRPNIVFMLADDQGWSGTSVQMHPDHPVDPASRYRTPRLEAFAEESMRFGAAYAPAPVCSPTRASLLTGQSPARMGWTTVGGGESRNQPLVTPSTRRTLGTIEVTFAELLQEAGYATAHFGKWHAQGGGPERHGFDISDGNLGNEAAALHADPNPVDIFGMADRAEASMRRASEEETPFFVQLSWLALHAPENALESTKAKYAERRVRSREVARAALTEDLDTGVGRVLDALDRLGLAENTYVIYMSDNGGASRDAGPLGGGKGSLAEGGIRVPLIIRGPGIEAGSWCETPVVGFDLFPTYLAWARVEASTDVVLDGGTLTDVLFGDTDEVVRAGEGLLFHFPHYHSNGSPPQSALILDGFKLVRDYESGEDRLYDLSRDIGEEHDLSNRQAHRARSLARALDQALGDLDAEISSPNARYTERSDESESPRRGRSGTRRGTSQR